jgi:EAL domain-containing protein (putative c-di-GMP-specific phosphodiesterase class I)
VRAWDLAGIPLVTLGVNISALDLGTADLPDRILAVITESRLAASQVELEVTESVAFENENARSNIAKLRALGFRVAIDDFGVGFSMLGRLQDLPVDRLKIDRSFIERITFGEDEAPIVTGIIAMAHSLRLKVIAEGVETTEQLTFLRRNGCDQVQGFRLGRPMPAQEIEPILRSRTSNLA